MEADSFMVIVCKLQTPQQIRAGPRVDTLATNRTLIAW